MLVHMLEILGGKGAMERLMEVVYPKWKALGMVDEIVITQSNLDDTLQIQQMRQMIDGGKSLMQLLSAVQT